MDYQDLESAVSDLQDNIGDYDVSDTLDSISDTLDNQNDTNTDLDQRLTDVENTAGQLQFPLTQDTIDLITEQAPSISASLVNTNGGTVQLVAGAYTINNPIITTSSFIYLGYNTMNNSGTLFYTIGTGVLNIHSTSSTDTSKVNYLIMS